MRLCFCPFWSIVLLQHCVLVVGGTHPYQFLGLSEPRVNFAPMQALLGHPFVETLADGWGNTRAWPLHKAAVCFLSLRSGAGCSKSS